MSVREIIAAMLLGVGVFIELLCAVGVLVMRNPFDRLHYLAPATSLGPLAVAAAVLVAESDAQAKIKSVLVAVVLLATGPILTHATARAAWARLQAHPDTGETDQREES
ncbi:MAG TPA: monovalent cation/H(+) antiporter subunit G [Gemmataceae bacterium]|nr:monovalent cation/H(+) antiporter subunit G [Gemmataceae bacterium]